MFTIKSSKSITLFILVLNFLLVVFYHFGCVRNDYTCRTPTTYAMETEPTPTTYAMETEPTPTTYAIETEQAERVGLLNNNSKVNQKSASAKGGNPTCKRGYFYATKEAKCRRWFNCEEIGEYFPIKKTGSEIGHGFFKQVYRVPWVNHSQMFALSVPYPTKNKKDFQNKFERVKVGVSNLLELQPNKHVIPITGYCEQNDTISLLTEYCGKYNTLKRFVCQNHILDLSPRERLRVVIQVIEALVYLHYGSGQPKVHCDLHTPFQALGQFLIKDDGNVVLNDLDELPIDDPENNQTALCRTECRTGKGFLAPEVQSVNICRRNKGYTKATTKADVWKIPSLSNAILNDTIKEDKHRAGVRLINYRLANVHARCRVVNITERPTSSWVLQKYMKIYNEMEDGKL